MRMKALVVILSLCLLNSLYAMSPHSEATPTEILFYNKNLEWALEDEKEHERNVLVETAILSLANNANLNTNYNNSAGFGLYGNTSLLFDMSDDDNLIGIASNLMKEGACPNFATSTGHTPFERAIRSNAVGIAWKMLSYEADCKRGILTLMDHACNTSDKKLYLAQSVLAKKMLEILGKQKVVISKITDSYGQNLLMKITQIKRNQSGKIETPEHFRVLFAGLLLKHKVDPYEPDFHGDSAIEKARKNKLESLVFALEGKFKTSDLV